MDKNRNLPKIAMGAWAWGDDGTFGGVHTAEAMKPVFEAAMKNGLNLWDTAYVYGMGTSEKTLGSFLKELPRDSYYLSDKFTPQCADRKSNTPVADMLETQYRLLETDSMDIYWIHNPVDAPHWTKELAKYFEGRENVPMLGISNHNLAEIKEAARILKEHGLRLSAVQNHYSLLNRTSESSGILEYCRENGMIFFAYMVLEQGVLSGKYDVGHPLPQGSDRGEVYNEILPKVEPLLEKMREIGNEKGVSPAQIATAWAIGKGTLPIVGVTKIKHVEVAVMALEISLNEEDTNALELLADQAGVNTIRYWEKAME